MGDAVGVHPLVVIFGLLVGEQLLGLVGMLIAIPAVVVVKEAAIFAADHLMVRYPESDTLEEQDMVEGDPPPPTPSEAGLTPVATAPTPVE